MTTHPGIRAREAREHIAKLQCICDANELFLLRTLIGSSAKEVTGKREVSHATVISFKDASAPTKANPVSALGVEPNPFYISIMHPRPCRSLFLCCASIGPVHAFRPNLLRAALRVFIPRGCKPADWKKAVSWFWQTMEDKKGKKLTKGTQWVTTGGLEFWLSLESGLREAIHRGQVEGDTKLGRAELLAWVNDLLRRSQSPLPHRRHVLHTTRIVDPGTLKPVFDCDSDEGYRVLCGVDTITTDEEWALVRCYECLFDDSASLLHEPINDVDRHAWEQLVQLHIARRHGMNSRTFYYSPKCILMASVEAMSRPPRAVIDAGLLHDKPLDLLARIMIYPVREYLLVYDSTVTADSPVRRLLMSQLENTPRDLATVVTPPFHALSKATTTQRIRQVSSSIYRKTMGACHPESQNAKTIFLLDFAHWKLRQLARLCAFFETSRIMSKAPAAWVALNISEPSLSSGAPQPVDPNEWTQDVNLLSVFAWFDATFIEK